MDLAEPPLGDLLASMLAKQRWNDKMELDAEEEEPESSAQDGQDIPDEANIGLG